MILRPRTIEAEYKSGSETVFAVVMGGLSLRETGEFVCGNVCFGRGYGRCARDRRERCEPRRQGQ